MPLSPPPLTQPIVNPKTGRLEYDWQMWFAENHLTVDGSSDPGQIGAALTSPPASVTVDDFGTLLGIMLSLRESVSQQDQLPPIAALVPQTEVLTHQDVAALVLALTNQQPASATASSLSDTKANWTLANYDPASYSIGTTFSISDWGSVVYKVKSVAGLNKWVYFSGQYEGAYANLPTSGFDAAPLGVNDKGLLFYDSATYVRRWERGSSSWRYAPGEPLSGALSFAVLSGAGWVTCTGGLVTITTDLANTLPVTTPSAGYPKIGNYSPVPTAASIAGLSITPTDDTDAGVTINNPASGGTPANVALHPHQHADTLAVTATGLEPQNWSAQLYIKL